MKFAVLLNGYVIRIAGLSNKNSTGTSAVFTACHKILINRGSYMSAHVLLNVLNELGKRDKMPCLQSILSRFSNKFNKRSRTVLFSMCPNFDSMWLAKCIIDNYIFLHK